MNSGFLQTVLDQAAATAWTEWLAVLSGIAYLLLAVRQNIWCWFFAAVSSATYVYVFLSVQLYMESVLNLFYLAMAFYGFYVWTFATGDRAERPVERWPLKVHVIAVVLIAVAANASAVLLTRYTDAAFPLVDSLTTFAAIWTTFLVARKVFENWWYWLVIDSVSVVLFVSRDLYLTALLFLVYLAIIPFGMAAWRRSMHADA